MIVELMKPQPNEIICDPACGTSGFLVTASEYLRENFKEEIYFDRQKKDHYKMCIRDRCYTSYTWKWRKEK